MSRRISIGTVVSHLVVIHLGLTVGNASYSLVGETTQQLEQEQSHNIKMNEQQRDIQSALVGMYSGRGIDRSLCTPNVVFRDPIVVCNGDIEVEEAFRALKALSPKLQKEPFLIGGSSTGIHSFRLQTDYFMLFSFSVDSLCIVETDSDGRITLIEERWNHTPLLKIPPYTWAKRLNGLISYRLSTYFIR